MSPKTPVDLVVGIDFGMTYTGVAYTHGKHLNPRVIQSWPGKHLERNNKVPSSIVYHPGGPAKETVKDWGFKSQNADAVKEWFKPFLDPDRVSLEIERRRIQEEDALQESDIPDYDEARRYYKDYMRCLYAHLSKEIQDKTGYWESKRVEFIFSLPCTFHEHEIGRRLLTLIKRAGFGTEGERHTVALGLTEPEAAAVFTIRESAVAFEAGTNILVCDAGGGTTDLAILRIVINDDDEPELEELAVVEGRNVGSTGIDIAFERLVDKRLAAVDPALPDNTAWSMMHSSEFLGWKCSFGQDDSKDFPSFPISVPTVRSDFNHRGAKIVNGKMHFSQREFQSLFDGEVDELIRLIARQIRLFKNNHRHDKLDYIVLSGGLGSSAYVKCRAKANFEEGTETPNLQVLVSEEPQMAVVKGLVIDRVQKLRKGKAVLKSRKCRASYGVELSIPYDKEEHTGQECYRGLDGVLYARGQIIWLIRKGEIIDPEKPIIKPGNKDFLPSDTSRKVESTIYMSWSDPKRLPTNTNHADAQYVCRIEFDLTRLGLKRLETKGPSKNLLSSRRPTYYRANFETKIIVGAADLNFEVWFRGRRYGREYVSVMWA